MSVLAQAVAAAADSDAMSWAKTAMAALGPVIAVAIALRKSGHKAGAAQAIFDASLKKLIDLEASLKLLADELENLRGIDAKGSFAVRKAVSRLESVLSRLTDKFQILSSGFDSLEEEQRKHGQRLAVLEEVDTRLHRIDEDIKGLRNEVVTLIREVGKLDGRVSLGGRKGG